MFLFNSLHKGSAASKNRKVSGSLRRHWAWGVFALAVMFCLSALLFTGCKDNGFVDDHKLNSNLIGTWTSTYGDSYVITANKITYDDGGYGGGYASTIRDVSNFSDNAGVIIIEYDADKKPTYYDSFDNYGKEEHIVPLNGDFIGIYYKDFKPGVSVSMGVAVNSAVVGGSEEATLDAAVSAFNVDNVGKYMSYWGAYTK
jgi:hypothetical protein